MSFRDAWYRKPTGEDEGERRWMKIEKRDRLKTNPSFDIKRFLMKYSDKN
jgi:hypothetical protein